MAAVEAARPVRPQSMHLPMKPFTYLSFRSLIGNASDWALGTIVRGLQEMRALLPELQPSASDDQSVLTEEDDNNSPGQASHSHQFHQGDTR